MTTNHDHVLRDALDLLEILPDVVSYAPPEAAGKANIAITNLHAKLKALIEDAPDKAPVYTFEADEVTVTVDDELAATIHDLNRQVTLNNDLLNENEALRARNRIMQIIAIRICGVEDIHIACIKGASPHR